MPRALDVGYTLHDIRKYTLWGNLMAGGAGVEYYFGYGLPDNDLVAENFRSRDKSWDYGRIAIDFFHSQKIPFWEMTNADGARRQREARQQPILLREGQRRVPRRTCRPETPRRLDLSNASRSVHRGVVRSAQWRCVEEGSVTTVKGGAPAALGMPPDNPSEDWLVVVRRR